MTLYTPTESLSNDSLHPPTETRLRLIEKYVQFLESADKVQGDLEQLEVLLQGAAGGTEDASPVIEDTWARITGMIADLTDMGAAFVSSANKVSRGERSCPSGWDYLQRSDSLITKINFSYELKIFFHDF